LSVLLVDHNDSFTYNIAHLIASCGYKTDIFPYGPGLLERARGYKKVVLSPGPGVPENYPFSLQLLGQNTPGQDIFGICLGMQCLAVYAGATLFRQPNVRHGEEEIIHNYKVENSVMHHLDEEFNAALYHSWAVEASSLPDSLKVTAATSQGVIMGLMHRAQSIEAVQFHPESFLCLVGKQIMESWLSK